MQKKKKTQPIGEGDNFDDLRKYIYHSVISIDLNDLIVGSRGGEGMTNNSWNLDLFLSKIQD